MKLKYVKLEGGEVIIFPELIQHKEFKYLEPISAGFCYIEKDRILCFGDSVSLKIKSNPGQDSLDATKHFIGTEEMINLLKDKDFVDFVKKAKNNG